ncbi:hypothetical protein [Bacillus swezeyi]|uniref:hypothetical protein n=1 Tax=Bacillus swezeyi TaxID=1925020 RepID=UPI001680F6AC|nr:hypothetical protein [Bacillus swezeyi]
MDSIRQLFINTKEAKKHNWNAGHFSYNVGKGVCPACMGTGAITLAVQYLPEEARVWYLHLWRGDTVMDSRG